MLCLLLYILIFAVVTSVTSELLIDIGFMTATTQPIGLPRCLGISLLLHPTFTSHLPPATCRSSSFLSPEEPSVPLAFLISLLRILYISSTHSIEHFHCVLIRQSCLFQTWTPDQSLSTGRRVAKSLHETKD